MAIFNFLLPRIFFISHDWLSVFRFKICACYVLPVLAASVLVSVLAHRLCLSLQESTFPALVTFSRYEHQFARSRPRRSADACHTGGAVDVQVVRVSLTRSLLSEPTKLSFSSWQCNQHLLF